MYVCYMCVRFRYICYYVGLYCICAHTKWITHCGKCVVSFSISDNLLLVVILCVLICEFVYVYGRYVCALNVFDECVL